jgi:ferredoxin
VRVDPTKCRGHGICVEVAADHFSPDDWGYVQSAGEEVAAPDAARVQRAVERCPYGAIHWVARDARVPRLLPLTPTSPPEGP